MNNKSGAKTKIKTVEQISAGGVAFRKNGGQTEVAIISVNPSRRWQLPKGLIDGDETEETAARREVREEAGIECEPLGKVETVEYWYYGDHSGERVRFHKLVHFFLMRYVSGDTNNHDHEVAEARWVKINEAFEMLAFDSEKQTIKKASKMIAELQ